MAVSARVQRAVRVSCVLRRRAGLSRSGGRRCLTLRLTRTLRIKPRKAGYLHVSRHMRAIAFLALSLATFQACHAGDRAPPFDFAGQYTRSHQVRDWIGQCPSGQPSQCAQVTVTDRVLVTRSGPSRFHIEVSLAFDDLHVCDFSGVGKWNGRALVARSNDTEDSCTVSVIFAKGPACSPDR